MHLTPRESPRRASQTGPKANASLEDGVIAKLHAGDRRYAPRAPYVSRVAVTVFDDAGSPADSWECTSHNLSRDGLAFSSRRRIDIGSHVIVETPSPIPGRNISYYGVVRQVREMAPDSFFIGISFEPMPKGSAIHDWLMRRPTLPET